ncbi:copper-transporting ATPase [Aquipluma nitroreducens]|uniref:Copper-transporting ATPase n=1 Tax=Aquipluma nitroreducens TaxID=2010828 RepID=A0A5K7S514_9BACT|nr:cation transporter [Aquipluma nitroreducens]BBE16616.1 copper-transporting ATPase [Aquipluma nitroreducens]
MKQILFIVLVLLGFIACNSPQKTAEKAQAPVMVEAKLKVEGMTCNECEASVAKGVNELAGIDSISANHLDSTAFVRFDSNKTSLKDISKAIENRGYVVASK